MIAARRIFVEKRAFIIPLVIAVVGNLLVYGLVVYPLRVKSLGAADRARNAATTLAAAEQDFKAARELVLGKSRAEQELLTFYGKVLPHDQLSALRLTYGPIPALARKANVKVLARRWSPEPPQPDARVARLVVRVSLEGDYESFRQFVYALETSPEFVVVDDVTISFVDPARPLIFTLELSTYYPVGAAGG
jgi:Type II secretion system (T2SS), protein M subtype b